MRPASYGHGTILAGAADEARKSTQGRRMIRERVMALGKDSIYNLTGWSAPFHSNRRISSPWRTSLPTTPTSSAAEQLALPTQEPIQTRVAVLCHRVSAAMLAIMLGTLKPGERVLSLRRPGALAPVGATGGRSDGGDVPGGAGAGSLERAMHEGTWRMLAITPLTPSMYHLPAADVAVAVDMARRHSRWSSWMTPT